MQKKRPVFIVFYYEEGGGVGRKVKRLWSYFLHHVFVGVFQYVPGPPKHVLHLVWSFFVFFWTRTHTFIAMLNIYDSDILNIGSV